MPIAQRNRLQDPGLLFCEGKKLTGAAKTLIWNHLERDPQIPSRRLLNEIAPTHGPIDISVGHLNKIRKQWKRSCPQGRPHQTEPETQSESSASLIQVIPHLSHVGVHLFDDWLEQQNGFGPVVESLHSGIEMHKNAHPQDQFALLGHREETLKNHFKAMFYAPLFEIDKLSEFDYKENPLETLIGRGYQGSTLNQSLGQLERIDAAPYVLPVLLPAQCGKIGYIDGHLIAFWTSVSMHKGKITNVGRIMSGSCAVITHDEKGQALFVQYYPPDIHLPLLIVEYCEKISKMTGIEVFVMDREVNAVEMARSFRDKEWGLLCMLDSNQYKGLESFETRFLGSLEDGTLVYRGIWEDPKKQKDDPRIFVIAKEMDRVLVYWGTSKVEAQINPKKWPEIYRRRSEVQENSFKRMKDHGALDVNFGNKKIFGPDRHQQRKKDEIEANLAKARAHEAPKAEVVKEKQEKVEESEEKGHTKRLLQRQAGLETAKNKLKKASAKRAEIEKKLSAVGEAKQRADRDFRKQTIMTFRTLFLENKLISFLFALGGHMSGKISLETLLEMFFDRSGSRLESDSQIIYWVNTQNLSAGYHETLVDVVEGINAMGLKRKGKRILVRMRAGPT